MNDQTHPKEDFRELLLGCGYRRGKLLGPPNQPLEWKNLTTLDLNPRCKPDILFDLSLNIWPFDADTFDEVHAYEVLEHLGRQGDIPTFFATFNEIHRILKPGGFLYAMCPSRYSVWLWGDPGHRRAIMSETLLFLDRGRYKKAASRSTPMADYRDDFRGDFDVFASQDNNVMHIFSLQAVKPVREW